MATYTSKYNLKKPAPEDFVEVSDLNGNFDIIDETLSKKADLDETGKVDPEQLPTMDYVPTSDKGEAGGVATLGQDGKVPGTQLPEMDYEQKGAAKKAVGDHDASELAHPDIRLEIANVKKTADNAQDTADEALEALASFAYTIQVVPSQSGTLTYTGEPQSPVWSSYNPDTLTLSGDTTKTAAGTYQATFTPKEKYKWADGTNTAKTVNWTIDRAPVAVPTQAKALTYSAGSQSPDWTNYDPAKLTLGGTTTGINAGSYDATFTPKDNYCWAGGGYAKKTVSWTIGKATGILSLSVSQLDLNVSKKTGTITVTRSGTGAVTARSSTDNATVSVNSTTVTVTAVSNGSAVITVEAAGDNNYTAPPSKTCSVTVSMPNKTLANNTWAQIAQAAEAGQAESYWKVGDTKDITVSGETLTLVIVGFKHDDLASGGKAGITFGLKNLMKTKRQMNSSNTNVGGFTGSAMYTWLQGDLLKALPSDLQAVLKSVNKKTSAGSASSTINTNAMKIFLFSEVEVFGTTTYSATGEGSQYSYFATAGNRVKYLENGSGAADLWWERSPRASDSYYFCYVYSGGNAFSSSASYSWGVCFGFCV